MPTYIVNLEPSTQRVAPAHRVYLRARWTDEWEQIPWLFAEEVAWRLAPGLGTASIVWRYGRGMRQGELAPATVARLADVRRAFVKIEIDTFVVTQSGGSDTSTATAPLRWFGLVELDGRAQEGLIALGDGTFLERGLQPLECVDLAHALYRHPIRGATWLDTDGTERRAGRPFIFNRPNAAGQPEGNRSTSRGVSSYLFSSKVGSADKLWTTRTIQEYLRNHEAPTGAGGATAFVIGLDPDSEELLPDWDQPVIDPHGQSTGELLDQLLPASRMLSWHLNVTTPTPLPGGTEADIVFLRPISFFGSDVSTDLGTFKAAVRQLKLCRSVTSDNSPDLAYSLKESDLPLIDQARVRGARRTSTCTLSQRGDNTATEGWSVSLEDEYKAGASDLSGYASWKKAQKQAANNEIRESDRLFPVYRRFTLVSNWTQKVKDGLGGGGEEPVFIPDEDGSALYLVNPRELFLAPTLAIAEGFDYTDIGDENERKAPTAIFDGPHNRLPAIVLFKDPIKINPDDPDEADRYVQVEKIGASARIAAETSDWNRAWSGRVQIADDDRAVLIDVQGQPQHTLAFSDFDPLSGVDEDTGKWDWRDALFTVTLTDDRHAEGIYPTDETADEDVAGSRRELVVHVGDAYRLDYLVPNTVIGIDTGTRGLLRCSAGGWINDDRKPLAARARQLFEYFGRTRRSLVLETRLLNSAVQLGDYVQTFGRTDNPRDVGTPISEILVTIPGGERPGSPQIRYATAFAQFEVVELANKRPEVTTGRRGRR